MTPARTGPRGVVAIDPAPAPAIINTETAQPDLDGSVPSVAFQRGSAPCGGAILPDSAATIIQMHAQDKYLLLFTGEMTGDTGMAITTRATMRYVGN